MKSRQTKRCWKKSHSERVARLAFLFHHCSLASGLPAIQFASSNHRHEAIHAIGLVLSEHIYDLARAREPETRRIESYYAALERLTADYWRRSG
jgi:hypothetical protein